MFTNKFNFDESQLKIEFEFEFSREKWIDQKNLTWFFETKGPKVCKIRLFECFSNIVLLVDQKW